MGAVKFADVAATSAAVAAVSGRRAKIELLADALRRLSPMLAASAATPAEALAITGAPTLVDTKLDGIRIQVHRDGDDMAVFSRSLEQLTARMPEVVTVARAPTERNDWLVRVRPEQVVEIAFDGVQASPRYPGGVTLRFARVIRYREDKSAAEADTIDTVRAIHRRVA